MKKVSAIIISLISVLLLTGCGCKMGLDGITTTRKNSFFSNGELNKLHLEGLPKLEFESSYLEVKATTLTGYFNVESTILDSYATEVFDYYKSSELTYGAIMDYGYMFGIPNIFDMLKVHDLHKFTQHLSFYKIYGDRYIFFYEVDDTFYELCIRKETNTVDKKDYNFSLKVGKVSLVRWSDDYQEYFVTDENIDTFVIDSSVKYFEKYPDYAEIKLEYSFPMNAHCEYIDVHLLVDYTEFGVPGTRPCDTTSPNSIDDCCTFTCESGVYQEGDIEIKRVYVAKESAYITKKESSTNNNNNSVSEE